MSCWIWLLVKLDGIDVRAQLADTLVEDGQLLGCGLFLGSHRQDRSPVNH